MTAILAIENTEDMEVAITLPEKIFQELYEEEASMAGFQPGERARLKDLLYGILLQYALKDVMFKEVFTSSWYSTYPTEQHSEGFTFYSTMFQYMDSTEGVGGKIIGGKTGYTEEAVLCLASLAEEGAERNAKTQNFHVHHLVYAV